MYQKKVEVFKRFTSDLATLSKCQERQVAALITDTSLMQIYSIGLNGGPRGLADCMCVIDGKYGCIHAEINALIKCKSEAPNRVMFVTLAPCKQCAAAIINSPGGFVAVYYFEEWKQSHGLTLLRSAGIKVERV